MLLTLVLLAFSQSRPDIVFEDFEGDSYGRWTASGDAFGKVPARGTLRADDS